jgi:hypothetical protein
MNERRATLGVLSDERSATAILDDIEARLSRSPRRCFGVRDDAPASAICDAFAGLAHRAHPDRFVTRTDATRHRAARTYRRLREVFLSLTTIASPPGVAVGDEVDDDRITRRLWRGVGADSLPMRRKSG